jgi:hypothetical protein
MLRKLVVWGHSRAPHFLNPSRQKAIRAKAQHN